MAFGKFKINLNCLKYGVPNKADYELIADYRKNFNHKVWTIVSALATIYFFINTVTSFSVDVVKVNMITYASLTMVSMCACLLLFTVVGENSRFLLPVVYVEMTAMMILGIMIGVVNSPEFLAVTFFVVLVCLPLLVVDKPYRLGIFELIFCIIFVVLTLIYKEGATRDLDIFNLVMFGVLAQFVLYYMIHTRMSQFASAKKVELSSMTDALTGLYNRKAYEIDLNSYNDKNIDENLVYVAFDVNGLKCVNDTYGHDAGDELLIAAARAIQLSFGSYGKAYRTGGDEFAAIIEADANTLSFIKGDFENITAKWVGSHDSVLSISAGYVTAAEMNKSDFEDVSRIADQRMYANKSLFYKASGVDRRGQQDAYGALYALYTKILKVNLTKDNYHIILMDVEEQSKFKGFSDKISEWFKNFGTSGQVHPDDLEQYLSFTSMDYLKDAFKRGKQSVEVEYRRKVGDTFKLAAMEMVPANDYSDDNVSLFLYVKCIEK